ncbi:MAG: ISAzo13 family transposase [Chloroflexota bacterium]
MIATVQGKYATLSRLMNERLKRRWAGCEALASGRGGISAVARATGLSPNTIKRGMREIETEMPDLVGSLHTGERQRQPGGGRRRRAENDRTLIRDLKRLLEPVTRGDPMSHLMWSSKSTRHLAAELQRQGHTVSHMTVARLLAQLDYHLQANRKTREGTSHPDRDAQFHYINRQVRAFQRRGQPTISVDTKKRELVGDFKNAGREWRPQGQPQAVRIHDFRDAQLGVAIPYGVYDLNRNDGWVGIGIDHDTAAFAVATIRHWWRRMGHRAYPRAKELLITADAGGSNGNRSRLWKLCLQQLADETGLAISVCHFPPGTSKWNKIEHRMFCHITENWRGQPLVSHAVIINLIGHTRTRTGLQIKAGLDKRTYENGVKVSKAAFATINLSAAPFHGDWNYKIGPSRK